MKVVIQRCNSANVKVSNKIIGKIEKGYVLLVGFEKNDTKDIVLKMVNKIAKLRCGRTNPFGVSVYFIFSYFWQKTIFYKCYEL